jgi:hypothetical protein
MEPNYRSRGSKLSYQLSAAYQTLFTTNNAPQETQLAEIEDSVRVALELKADLEMHITEARMELLRLEREQLHVARHIERCKYPLAPVRRIPTEILSHIFACYADLVNDSFPQSRLFSNVREGVWILGHICGHWRAVALSTPAIWSSFFFSCGLQERKVKNISSLAEEFLFRSSSHPLSILFKCTCHALHPPDHVRIGDPCCDVFHALLARSRQWEVATVSIPPSLYPEMASIRDHLPRLSSLKLEIHFLDEAPLLNDLETFWNCPQLIDLQLSFRHGDFIHFPWHQLTRYDGDAVFASLSVLAEAPNIQNCLLMAHLNDRVGRPLVHQMRSLGLRFDYQFLDDLILPALEHLNFWLPPDQHMISPAITAHTNLLRRSASPLASIALHIFNQDYPIAVLRLLRDIPQTVGLLEVSATQHRSQETEATPEADQVFRGLVRTPEPDSAPILPMLRHLVIKGVAFGTAFVDMVESRCAVPSPETETTYCRLESLSLSNVGAPKASHLFRLRKLELVHGLKLTVQL